MSRPANCVKFQGSGFDGIRSMRWAVWGSRRGRSRLVPVIGCSRLRPKLAGVGRSCDQGCALGGSPLSFETRSASTACLPASSPKIAMPFAPSRRSGFVAEPGSITGLLRAKVAPAPAPDPVHICPCPASVQCQSSAQSGHAWFLCSSLSRDTTLLVLYMYHSTTVHENCPGRYCKPSSPSCGTPIPTCCFCCMRAWFRAMPTILHPCQQKRRRNYRLTLIRLLVRPKTTALARG